MTYVQGLQRDANNALVVSSDINGPVELGYAEITANQTFTSSVDVVGLAVTVTVGTRPIVVRVDVGALSVNNTASLILLNIVEGSTALSGFTAGPGLVVSCSMPAHREVRLAPTAGVHTYKITCGPFLGTTPSVTLGASATSPAFIQVIQV